MSLLEHPPHSCFQVTHLKGRVEGQGHLCLRGAGRGEAQRWDRAQVPAEGQAAGASSCFLNHDLCVLAEWMGEGRGGELSQSQAP